MSLENRARAVGELEDHENGEPLYQAGAQVAGSAGLGGIALKKLHDIQRLDHKTLTDSILQRKGGAEAVRDLFGMSPKKFRNLPRATIESMVRTHPELAAHWLTGNAKNPGVIQNLLGQVPDPAVKSVPGSVKGGFRWNRKFRGAGAVGVGAGLAYSLYDALKRNAAQQQEKSQASKILGWLRNSVTK
jgi:hypothetical protein